MKKEDNSKRIANKEIGLSLRLEDINKILMALGNLPYTQVYELIQSIRIQTELKLNNEQTEKTLSQENYEYNNADS